jgi:hypothetical protein
MALPSAAAVIALRILASSTMVMSFKPIGLTVFLRDFIALFPLADPDYRCDAISMMAPALLAQIHADTK